MAIAGMLIIRRKRLFKKAEIKYPRKSGVTVPSTCLLLFEIRIYCKKLNPLPVRLNLKENSLLLNVKSINRWLEISDLDRFI